MPTETTTIIISDNPVDNETAGASVNVQVLMENVTIEIDTSYDNEEDMNLENKPKQ